MRRFGGRRVRPFMDYFRMRFPTDKEANFLTSRLSCPGIAVRRTASLRSPMTRASMRPHGETQPYMLHSLTLIMDCRVKPGKDERGARCGTGRLLQVLWEMR